jgi:CRISPR-associated helicase Cas3
LRVGPLHLPLVEHSASRRPLYPHQVAVWDGWDKNATILLAAKSGTGKTRAAMLPILKRRESAMAVYPTNELLRDQVRAAARFSRDEGIESVVWTPEAWKAPDHAETYARAGHVLVPVDGTLLDQWQEATRCKSRGEALRRLLDPDKPKIVFTNPDILFLIFGLRYHAEPFEALRRYETLILDEFHLYQGVELAHALVMVSLARGFEIFRRVILLSATPPPEVRALLDRTVQPVVIESQAVQGPTGSGEWRTAVHSVEVTAIQATGADPVETLVPRLVALEPELRRLRRETPSDDYLPAVVILNSVLNAIRLEDRLVECGFPRNSLAIIRGLSHRAIRDRRGKLVALGTSAIEVGVDFHCDYLLFEAFEAASFLQRFGRVGRHAPGKAIVLVPPNAFHGMSAAGPEIDRAAFEEKINTWYPSATVRAWFVTSEQGFITARAQAENLIATVARDSHARPDVVADLRRRIEVILAEHAERLGRSDRNTQARSAFERCAAGKRASAWLDAYRRLGQFRTSLPSLPVHDFMEQSRRKQWGLGEYDIDLATLLRRAVGLAWNEKLRMLTVRGIGKYRQVHASPLFGDDECGMMLETRDFPNMLLYQDGDCTPVSDLMGRQNHVFSVAPRSLVEAEIDWKLPVFEAGRYLVAFDGAALMMLELWKRAAAAKNDSAEAGETARRS